MTDLAEAYRRRAESCEELDRQDAEELRHTSPESTIRIFEGLLVVGFDHIRRAYQEERGRGGDLRRLAKLVQGEE